MDNNQFSFGASTQQSWGNQTSGVHVAQSTPILNTQTDNINEVVNEVVNEENFNITTMPPAFIEDEVENQPIETEAQNKASEETQPKRRKRKTQVDKKNLTTHELIQELLSHDIDVTINLRTNDYVVSGFYGMNKDGVLEIFDTDEGLAAFNHERELVHIDSLDDVVDIQANAYAFYSKKDPVTYRLNAEWFPLVSQRYDLTYQVLGLKEE